VSAAQQVFNCVMAGLDPAIQASTNVVYVRLDARVKPAHD
jgi:hypothetical protein